MDWEIEFYDDSEGSFPVQDFIADQPPKVKAKLLRYIDMLEEFNLSLGRPYVEKLADTGVWELRMRFSSDYYRILYFAHTGRRFILLHAIKKKTNRTPKTDIITAEDRMREYKTRYRR